MQTQRALSLSHLQPVLSNVKNASDVRVEALTLIPISVETAVSTPGASSDGTTNTAVQVPAASDQLVGVCLPRNAPNKQSNENDDWQTVQKKRGIEIDLRVRRVR